MNEDKLPDSQDEEIQKLRKLIKKNFNEVELDFFGLTVNMVFSILEKMVINPNYNPIIDLTDENITEQLYQRFEGWKKEEVTKNVAERFERGKTCCDFRVKKALPMEIHYRDAKRDIVVGRVVYGSQESTHSYAIARFNELLDERLKTRPKGIIDGWGAGGGGSIYCEVTEKEGQLEYVLRFSGSSATYGYVEDETFENWMRPTLQRYLKNAGLTHVKVRRGLE